MAKRRSNRNNQSTVQDSIASRTRNQWTNQPVAKRTRSSTPLAPDSKFCSKRCCSKIGILKRDYEKEKERTIQLVKCLKMIRELNAKLITSNDNLKRLIQEKNGEISHLRNMIQDHDDFVSRLEASLNLD